MMWTIINKSNSHYIPSDTNYRIHKKTLRAEANEKCVYCAIHENNLGGIDCFHVEHYKPKSKFSLLEFDYENLFYACAICNRFKSNDWPNEPLANFSNPSYPDPQSVNYNDLFTIKENGVVTGNFVASKYMVEKIVLNRPQLINARREIKIREIIDGSICELKELGNLLLDKQESKEKKALLKEWMEEFIKISTFLNNEHKTSKYRPSEIKRV